MLDIQVLQLIEQYVTGEIPFADFSQRFAGLYFAVRQGRDVSRQASRLCSLAIGPLAELSRGDRSQESLRGALREIGRSFVLSHNQAIRWTKGSVSLPQQVNLQFGPSCEARDRPQISSKSLLAPEMLELSCA